MDLVYELLSQAVKNTNININLTSNLPTTEEPKKAEVSGSAPVDTEPPSPQDSGLVSADLVQLISDLENVSATLKKINMSLVGHEFTEVFLMLQNFDRILNSAKILAKLWSFKHIVSSQDLNPGEVS